MANPAATSNACRITVRWSCSTNLGALVVPDVVKMAQPASGVARIFGQGGFAGQLCVRMRRLAEYGGGKRGARFIVQNDRRQMLERLRVAGRENPGEVYPLEFRPEDEQPRARPVQDVGELVAAEARVHRHGDRAQLRAGKEHRQPGRQVRQPQRDAIARAHAELAQPLRDAAAFAGEFAIRNRPAAVDQRRRGIVDALREQRVQCVGNQNKNSRIRKKFSRARKKLHCGDCIRETLPISCSLA